jgi:predicted nuclease of predicted toxin-antitoxin system
MLLNWFRKSRFIELGDNEKNIPRFIIDVSVGVFVEDYLLKEGVDFVSVRNINPRMKDAEILGIAVQEKRIVLTMDKDFGELVYNCGQNHAGVLLLRLEDENASEKIKTLAYILDNYASQLQDHFCVFSNNRFRIK